MSDDIHVTLEAQGASVPGPEADIARQHAEARPGLTAPRVTSREAVSLAGEINQRIWQAQRLRRVVRDWKHDPTWPALHMALSLDYAVLLDLDTNSAAWQRQQIEALLGIEATR